MSVSRSNISQRGAVDVDELARRLRVLEDREGIRDVLFRYARAVDRCDLDLLKSCYWPDSTDVHWFFNGNGHAFAEWVIGLLARIDNTQHSITNPIIELDGDRAFVESCWHVMHRVPLDDETFIDQQLEGRFLDVFSHRGGEWRISHRQTVQEAAREHRTTFKGAVVVAPDHPRRGQRAPYDPSYQGFNLADVPLEPAIELDLWALVRARHADPARRSESV